MGPKIANASMNSQGHRLAHSKNWVAADFFLNHSDGWRRTPVAITRKSDWSTRWYDPPKGSIVLALTITDANLYAVLTPANGRNYGEVTEVLRFDLSRIDEFTSASYPYADQE